MKAVGIVVEYNPFHAGHAFHLAKAKELTKADIVVAVMSPNFVQRGEPAIVDKGCRTQMALQAGVDLVIELPTIYAIQHADLFAYGAIQLLHALDVKTMVFGSETGSTEAFLSRYEAAALSSPRSDELLRDFLSQGYGYPKAKALAFEAVHQFHLETPNDILGYAYLKAIRANHFPIEIITIPRLVDHEHSSNLTPNILPSAKAVRNALLHKQPLFNSMPIALSPSSTPYSSWNDYFPNLHYRLLSSSPGELRKIHLMSEGLEYLLLQAAQETDSYDDFLRRCVSKRYSAARLNRTLLHVLLNTDAALAVKWISSPPPYIRPLGMNENGRHYLHLLRQNTPIPVLSRFANTAPPMLQYEKRSSDLYYSSFPRQEQCLLRRKELFNFPIMKP